MLQALLVVGQPDPERPDHHATTPTTARASRSSRARSMPRPASATTSRCSSQLARFRDERADRRRHRAAAGPGPDRGHEHPGQPRRTRLSRPSSRRRCGDATRSAPTRSSASTTRSPPCPTWARTAPPSWPSCRRRSTCGTARTLTRTGWARSTAPAGQQSLDFMRGLPGVEHPVIADRRPTGDTGAAVTDDPRPDDDGLDHDRRRTWMPTPRSATTTTATPRWRSGRSTGAAWGAGVLGVIGRRVVVLFFALADQLSRPARRGRPSRHAR